MTKLQTEDIQGILMSGYAHLPYSRHLFIHFESGSQAQQWLAAIVPLITTANWYREGVLTKPEVGINLAFTHTGLRTIGYPQDDLDEFPSEFIAGMADPERARRLGDSGRSAPEHWEIGGPKTSYPIHALLILQAKSAEEADALAQIHQTGVRLTAEVQAGWTTPKGQNREHFGFADGISQIEIAGSPKENHRGDVVPAGEFILGSENAQGMFPPTPTVAWEKDQQETLPITVHDSPERRKDFGKNGTYLVFRKLFQDVAQFRQFIRDNAEPELRGRLAAKLVGRWPSGAALTLFPDKDPDPSGEAKHDNAFGYRELDTNGLRCPIAAHIRRANPRDGLEHDSGQSLETVGLHRMLRRGMNYGPGLPEGARDDGKDRGLFFICLNADIRRQFEFVQQTWLNNPKFAGLSGDSDPLVGENFDSRFPTPGPHYMTIPDSPVRRRLRGLPRFVTVRGGDYFFLPSLSALRYLCSLSGPWTRTSAAV
jgi:Dyp-type peroxidase family